MATKEQIDTLIEALKKVKPIHFVTKIDETSAGIGAVLRYLYESKETVTAGKISSFMNVSTARARFIYSPTVSAIPVPEEANTTLPTPTICPT